MFFRLATPGLRPNCEVRELASLSAPHAAVLSASPLNGQALRVPQPPRQLRRVARTAVHALGFNRVILDSFRPSEGAPLLRRRVYARQCSNRRAHPARLLPHARVDDPQATVNAVPVLVLPGRYTWAAGGWECPNGEGSKTPSRDKRTPRPRSRGLPLGV